jgi:hypothetical protein
MTASTPLQALVVFESMFGNTEKVAGAVARGLQLEGVDTGLAEVRSAPTSLSGDLDLLVVGGPTHGFSMSRPPTRADAVERGASPERATTGIREWLESVGLAKGREPVLAAFDTRVTKVRRIPLAASSSASRLGHKRGLTSMATPTGFLVDDTAGPLVEGELERAVSWGRELGVRLVERAAAAGAGTAS